LFSAEGRLALGGLRRGALIALDFDGTLVPISARPKDAYLAPNARRLLRALGKLTPVAVLSGRGLGDLRRHLGFQPRFLIGNHGLESEGFARQARSAARLTQAWAEQLGPSQHLENKIYSLSLHYRAARNRAQARRRLLTQIAALHPQPRLVGGKCVFNLMPAVGVDKGVALKRLIQRTSASQALFIGDDITDEDAFRVKHRNLLTVRVGRNGDTGARSHVLRQADVLRVLEYLVDRFHTLR
jgi:trehalose 6-phosphate phosphatase